jgi:hypothetical protein
MRKNKMIRRSRSHEETRRIQMTKQKMEKEKAQW